MEVWRSLAGMIQVELTSAEIGNTLAAINRAQIRIWNANPQGDLTISVWIQRRDYPRLEKLLDRRGERLEVVSRKGIYWNLRQLLQRPVLLMGIACLLVMVLFVPSRIYFVQVQGNETLPQKLILAAAEESGIRFGASRRAVRSEKMKNELLSALPQLQWAGVNTYGCVAVISVRERSSPEETVEEEGVCSIVAARDGIILSCTATRGNLLCSAGQAVQAGEVLISGYTDCGLTITATRAEGEVLAETQRDLQVLAPSEYQSRGDILSQTAKYSLIIGKKRINFYKGSGIWDASCGKMYTEYHLTLPGGFQLPVTLVKEVYTSYEISPAEKEPSDAETQLEDFAEKYLRQIMVAGQIVSSETLTVKENRAYSLTGEYACIEMIGRVQREKIGEYDGKTS